MAKPNPAATVAGELKLLLRSYPEVSLADLATALQSAPMIPQASGSWESAIEPVLQCAAAFGNPRHFSSKREALQVLSEELGVPSSWTNLNWKQLSSVAAAALIPHGPDKALDIMQRYRLTATRTAPSRYEALDETVAATVGIIHANQT